MEEKRSAGSVAEPPALRCERGGVAVPAGLREGGHSSTGLRAVLRGRLELVGGKGAWAAGLWVPLCRQKCWGATRCAGKGAHEVC